MHVEICSCAMLFFLGWVYILFPTNRMGSGLGKCYLEKIVGGSLDSASLLSN